MLVIEKLNTVKQDMWSK